LAWRQDEFGPYCVKQEKSKVPSMAKKAPEKEKTAKTSKPKQGPPGDDKPKKAKAKPAPDAAAEKEKAAAAAAAEKEKAKPVPRPPADLRLKVLKKFYGKFLPRGPLRDRHKTLMARWDSGEDHGGVTVEELRSLYNDWKTARAKPVRAAGASR
jgi:hypothetical protein